MHDEPVPGIRAAEVSAFFARSILAGDVPLGFRLIAGGRSNLTYPSRAAAGNGCCAARRSATCWRPRTT
jgi:hypothetical protein